MGPSPLGCPLEAGHKVMVGMVTRQMFFDSPRVMRAVDRATRRVLSRFGAFVRQTAKTSIRKRKRISRPGEPPSSHAGLLRAFIYFGYDADRRSVVIGPTPLHSREYRGGEVPALLEYGVEPSAGQRADGAGGVGGEY